MNSVATVAAFHVRVELPTGDTTVVSAIEMENIEEVVKKVESKKMIDFSKHYVYILSTDGKRTEGFRDETLSNYKKLEKLLLSPTDLGIPRVIENVGSGANTPKASSSPNTTPSSTPITSRRGVSALGISTAVKDSSGAMDSPSVAKTRFKGLKNVLIGKKSVDEFTMSPSPVNKSINGMGKGSTPRSSSPDLKGGMLSSGDKAMMLMAKKPRSTANFLTDRSDSMSETSQISPEIEVSDMASMHSLELRPSHVSKHHRESPSDDLDRPSITSSIMPSPSQQNQPTRLSLQPSVYTIDDKNGSLTSMIQVIEEDTSDFANIEKFNPANGIIWSVAIVLPAHVGPPCAVPYTEKCSMCLYKLKIPDEPSHVNKSPANTTLEYICERICNRKELEYDLHSFEISVGGVLKPAEMDRPLSHYFNDRTALELHFVKKGKSFTPIPVFIKEEEIVRCNMVRGKTLIIAAKKEAILKLLVDPTYEDEKFLDMIFLTFRNFATADEFLNHMIASFFTKLSDNPTDEEKQSFEANRLPTQLKVIRVLHRWIEHHWHDFGLSGKLRVTLKNFLVDLSQEPEGPFVEVTRGLLYVVDIQRLWFEDLLGTYSTGERKNKHLETMFDDLEVEDIAQQLCILNCDIFRNIHPIEFLSEIWKKPGDESSPSYKFFTERFDKESYWVATELLNCKDFKKRVKFLCKFISLSQACIDLNNFFSTFSIISGLNLIPVQRLKKTWEAIPEKSRNLWTEVEKIADPSKNMKNLRDKMLTAAPPMIPLLSIYFKDLIFFNDGNQSKVDGMINVDKLRCLAEKVQDLSLKGSTPYPFEKKSAALNYLEKPLIEKNFDKLKELAAELEKQT
ncbi:ras guanine nucleotide exchange factor domain-containing protein [Globomyces pollinis-pini]|nr:ras guanine nucleotide exchange factor domain-containing protein [Globomyces pollinis-pini]